MPARIIALPKRGIAYVDCLYEAVEELGIEVIDGHPERLWPLFHVRPGDVVHIHWPSFYYYNAHSRLQTWLRLMLLAVRLTLVRALGGRIAWTAHNLYPHDGGNEELAHRWCRRFLTRIAQAVFVHGPTAAGIVASEWGVVRAKLVQIAHGHWIDRYPNETSLAEARAKLRISSSAYVFGFVGLCKPYKNLELLIDAFSKCTGDCVLLIAGKFQSPDYLALIRKLLAVIPAGKLHFEPRYLADDELQHYLAACDAIILPYREILTSGSALLALSFGRPVVAPDTGGLKDTIDEGCGVLYDPAAFDGLYRALQRTQEKRFDEADIIARVQPLDWLAAAQELGRILSDPQGVGS